MRSALAAGFLENPSAPKLVLQQVAPCSSFEPHDSGIQRFCLSRAGVRLQIFQGCCNVSIGCPCHGPRVACFSHRLAPLFAATPGEPASCDLQLQRTSKLRSSSSWRYRRCSKIKMEPRSNPFCQLCECLSQVPDARDSHRSPQPIPGLRGERHFGLKSCVPGWAVRPCKSRSLDPTNV